MSEAMQALYEGDVERARALLPEDDRLTIFEAAAFGRVDALRAMVAADPSQVDAVSDDGFTPLHLAVFAAQEEAAELLIRQGADVNALAESPIARVRPLGTAAFALTIPLARLLLDSGADPDGAGEGGFTALHTAAQNGDVEMIQLLLERGASAEHRTDDGRTPADFAVDDEVRGLLERRV